MKKIKRILALLGVIFLLGLYVMTLISAFTDDPDTMHYFSAALLATVIVPALMWAYSFIYRLLAQHGRDLTETEKTDAPGAPPASGEGSPESSGQKEASDDADASQ